jgi:hypothetical protein
MRHSLDLTKKNVHSIRGAWRLLVRNHPTVWIEKTLVEGRIDRAEGPHALGRAL